MARILDNMKSMAGKMMASPYDQPGQDSLKMSSTGEVRAYVPPVQQRVKRPERQPTEQMASMNTASAPQAQQIAPEPRQGFFGGLFRRNQPAQEQQYTGQQQPPMQNGGYTSQQGAFNTVLNGRSAEVGGVRAFLGRIFGNSRTEAQGQADQGYTGQQPMQGTGQQPMQQPMQGTGRQPMQQPGYTGQQPMGGFNQPMQYTNQQPMQGTAQQPMQQPQQAGYTGRQPMGGFNQPMQYTNQQPMQGTAQQPMQQPGYTGQQQAQAQPTGFTNQQAMQGTAQQAGYYFSGQQPVQQGAQRPARGYFHGQQTMQQPQQPVQQQPMQGGQQHAQGRPAAEPVRPQPQQPQRPQMVPDNVSYMNAGHFVDEDGKAYAMVMRVAQPVGTATCYRIIEFIRNGEAVLVNTELITDPVELARSLDLLFGAAFAMHACYTRVAQRSLYLITPGSVKVTLYPSLNDLHQRDNARHWPGSEMDNRYDPSAQAGQEAAYGRERHRRANRAY